MAAVRHELAELEKHFVVVNWDQPGSGSPIMQKKRKTYRTNLYSRWSRSDGVSEGTLRQEKIYLIGESWGSALGIFGSPVPESIMLLSELDRWWILQKPNEWITGRQWKLLKITVTPLLLKS